MCSDYSNMYLVVSVLLILLTCSTDSANILAIIPSPSYSHQIAFTHIWKELSLRGHQVTVVTTDPIKDSRLTNLTEIDIGFLYELLKDKPPQNLTSMWNIHGLAITFYSALSEMILSQPQVRSLIHNKNHFDVVLVEFRSPELLAFAELYNCPKIIVSSVDPEENLHRIMGNPMSPALYPNLGTTFCGSLTFKERIISTSYTLYTTYLYNFKGYVNNNRLVKKHFNISRTVHEMLNDVDLMFINVNPILQPIRALGPSTVAIGGDRPVLFSTFLTQDVADFLDSANEGFVYFSLGSNIKSKYLGAADLKTITEVLGEIPYKVLWKFEEEELPNKPDNIKLIKWSPQQTVLAHKNIKVFVSQGGLQSMEEAIFQEVPLVVIPFRGDQYCNARLMKSKGIAVIVNRLPSINKIELRNAIFEVIANPKYQNTVSHLKHLSLDFPMTGLERAVWWTEYVIRNKGAKHLKNPAADIPFYQYYLLDVISLLTLILTVLLVLVFLLFKTAYRYSKILISRFKIRPSITRKKLE